MGFDINDKIARPLGDRVIVKRHVGEEKSAGGIIIPDHSKEKPLTGEVISVGPGATNSSGDLMPMYVSVGDVVLFSKYGGTEIKLPSEGDVLILKQADILVTLVDPS